MAKNPDPETLAQVFMQYNADSSLMMTYRDAEYIQWRFLDAPYRNDLLFYFAGSDKNKPNLVLVARRMELYGLRTVRLLDLWGNIDDVANLHDIIALAMKDAAQWEVEQIIAITTVPIINQVLRSLGFGMRQEIAFCWYTEDETEHRIVTDNRGHWMFADYDFDAPS